jgi:hypothetical protein
MTKRPGISTEESAALSAQSSPQPGSSKMVDIMTADDFTIVPTRDEKKKQKKIEKRRPQFQYDVSWFKQGKKVGIAVS